MARVARDCRLYRLPPVKAAVKAAVAVDRYLSRDGEEMARWLVQGCTRPMPVKGCSRRKPAGQEKIGQEKIQLTRLAVKGCGRRMPAVKGGSRPADTLVSMWYGRAASFG